MRMYPIRLLVLIAAGWIAIASARAADVARPNIVFVLVDDMGYGDLGCYGGKNNGTPHVDRVAAGGGKFTDFYSHAAVCTPPRGGVITRRGPQPGGVGGVVGD